MYVARYRLIKKKQKAGIVISAIEPAKLKLDKV